MEITDQQKRTILLFHSKLGTHARIAAENMCVAFGPQTVSKPTAYRWYERFDSGDFSLKDDPRPGRPIEVDLKLLKRLL